MSAPRCIRAGRPKRPRRLAAALAIGALFLIACRPPPPAPTSGKPDRVAHGLSLRCSRRSTTCGVRRVSAPLRLSRALSLAADEHSLSMAEHGYFEHSSPRRLAVLRQVVAVYASGARRWSVGGSLVWARRLSAREFSTRGSRVPASGDSVSAGVARWDSASARSRAASTAVASSRSTTADFGVRASSLDPPMGVESGGISADMTRLSPRD